MKLTQQQIEALDWAMKHAEVARDSVTSTHDKIYFENKRLALLAIKDEA